MLLRSELRKNEIIVCVLAWIIFSFTIFWSFQAKAGEQEVIYHKILQFNPGIDSYYAAQLARKITIKSKKAGVNPNISYAILQHESALRNINTYKTKTETKRYCEYGRCYETTTTVNEAFDMTIAQINIQTAVGMNLDIERLFNLDLDYALDCHYLILKAKIDACRHLGNKSWSCYHSADDMYRIIYVDLVSRYL